MGSPNLVKILRGSRHATPALYRRGHAILSPSYGSANSACPLRSLRCLHAEMHKSSSGSKIERSGWIDGLSPFHALHFNPSHSLRIHSALRPSECDLTSSWVRPPSCPTGDGRRRRTSPLAKANWTREVSDLAKLAPSLPLSLNPSST